MASSLDDLLRASAPPTTPHTPELARTLATLVSDAEAAAPGRSRLRPRILIGGLATIGVLGVGATASATGVLPAPWFDDPSAQTTQSTPSGPTCELRFRAKGISVQSHPVDNATRAKAVAAADAFLKGFDFSTIDVADVRAELERRVSIDLAQQGLPAETVSVSEMKSCTGDDQ
jgi:hypothetical protein